MNTTLLAFATLFSLAATAAHARHEAESFDEHVRLTRDHVNHLDQLQAEAEKPFLTVAPRCLNHWERYKAEYERVHQDLAVIARPLNQLINEYQEEVAGMNLGSPTLRLEGACGIRGEVVQANIFRKRELVKRLSERLAEAGKAVDALHERAWQIFEVDAPARDFGRNLSCLFRYQYVDVMRIAMFRDYYPRGERAPAPALYQMRDDLYHVRFWAEEEDKQLTENLVRLNSLRLSCAR